MVLQRLTDRRQVMHEVEGVSGSQGVTAAGRGDLLGRGGEGHLLGGEVDAAVDGAADRDLHDAGGLCDHSFHPPLGLQPPPAALPGRGPQRGTLRIQQPGARLVPEEGAPVVAEGHLLRVRELLGQRRVPAASPAAPGAQQSGHGREQSVRCGRFVRP